MIKEASIEDNERINYLGSLLNNEYNKLFQLANILNDKYAKIYVYVEDELILGFIHIVGLDEVLDIINIIVDTKYRKKSIGSKLLEFVINNAKDTVKSITLEVAVDNKAAIKFYEKHNFEVLNIRRGYYNGKDAYLMGRWIK